ncbi:cysteine desulfurase, partial [Blautia pseudococcoides]|nr:cysteine desulfurase [Blautia pseudococcoides]
MEAYLDNSATTKCFDEVKDIVVKTMTEDYGNPSAMHLKGVEAEKYVKEAAAAIAKTLKVQEKEIFFTSGGTESDNWALVGTALANCRQGKHIITTSFEHAAVSAPLDWLKEQGYDLTVIPVDEKGNLSMEELEAAIRPDTILVSTMYVNNEVGAVVPVEAVAKLVHEKNPKTVYHVDAIQGYGKYRIYPKRAGIDLLSVSSHKIHGPKGVGFLYVSEKVKIRPLILGGGQQKGMRSGTDNVPGIAGLGTAARMVYENHEEKIEKLRALKSYLAENLSAMERVVIN